jgi:hypothetical protein
MQFVRRRRSVRESSEKQRKELKKLLTRSASLEIARKPPRTTTGNSLDLCQMAGLTFAGPCVQILRNMQLGSRLTPVPAASFVIFETNTKQGENT